jgi:Chlorophyll A-B binding protein
MKSVVIASLLASAAAFAPAKQAAKSTAVFAKQAAKTPVKAGKKAVKPVAVATLPFEDELGAQAPLGFYDPFGQLNGESQERFDRLRYVEIKHGRICMLAFLGQVVTRAGIHLPGNIDYSGHSFDSYPNGVAALFGPNAIPTAGLVQLIAFIGVLECAVMKDVPGTGNEFIGDFRNGYIDFGWDTFDEEEKLSKRAIELNNGRAAQLGILGLMVHELIIPLGYDPELPIIGHLV